MDTAHGVIVIHSAYQKWSHDVAPGPAGVLFVTGDVRLDHPVGEAVHVSLWPLTGPCILGSVAPAPTDHNQGLQNSYLSLELRTDK